MKSLKNFLPTPEKLSQEVIATLCGILLSAWIVSQVPAFKQLVRESNT